MKTLSSPESPRQRGMRRVSKPLMEKRRRERINHSLETLRVLMLDNTHNEKLKNPKVEKAEILESVVHFLKTGREAEKGPRAAKRGPAGEQRPAGDRQRSYHDGMRSCLLRVSHFIASKSREEGGAGGDPAQARPSSAGAPGAQSLQRLPQRHRQRGAPHQYLSLHGDTSQLLSSSSSSSSTACTHITDPVWRPWPQ